MKSKKILVLGAVSTIGIGASVVVPAAVVPSLNNSVKNKDSSIIHTNSPIVFSYSNNTITSTTNINIMPTTSGGYAYGESSATLRTHYVYNFLNLPEDPASASPFRNLDIDSATGRIYGYIDNTVGNVNGTITVCVQDQDENGNPVNKNYADIKVDISSNGITITNTTYNCQNGENLNFNIGIKGGVGPYTVSSTNIKNIGSDAAINNLGVITCSSVNFGSSSSVSISIMIEDQNAQTSNVSVTFNRSNAKTIPSFYINITNGSQTKDSYYYIRLSGATNFVLAPIWNDPKMNWDNFVINCIPKVLHSSGNFNYTCEKQTNLNRWDFKVNWSPRWDAGYYGFRFQFDVSRAGYETRAEVANIDIVV